MTRQKFLFICSMLALLAFGGVKSATHTLPLNEISETQQLSKHLEILKGHLEDTIQKINHNIRARQADLETEIQTPDGEYVEAAIGYQRGDLIGAAAVPQVPLPLQILRNTKNSGLRRRR